MSEQDELKMLYGAYYGVMEMDSYKTKEFVLSRIKTTIDKFIKENHITDYEKVKKLAYEQSLITKLQDSLFILKELNESMELVLMIKEKISVLKRMK